MSRDLWQQILAIACEESLIWYSIVFVLHSYASPSRIKAFSGHKSMPYSKDNQPFTGDMISILWIVLSPVLAIVWWLTSSIRTP